MRNWKVGSISAGVILIAIGLLWFLQSFISFPYLKILLNTWPIACILLGIEILAFHLLRKEENLRFHWFSIILLIFVMITSIAFSFGHLAFKQFGIRLHSTTADINDVQKIPTTIEEIIIEASDGVVNVVGTDVQSLKVNGSMQIPIDDKKDLNQKLKEYYAIKTIGNKIYVKCKQENYSVIAFHDASVELNIELPKNIPTKIKLNNGSIHLQNKSSKTELEIEDGEMKLEDVSGKLIAKVNNGSIILQQAKLSENSKIETEDGNLEIANLKGELNAKVENGTVSVNKATLTKNSRVITEDGDVLLENVAGFINVTSSQGMTTIRHADLKGRSELITDDGDIHVEDLNGELFAQSSNGSITLNEAYFNGDSKITTEDGNIRIGIKENQDLTINAETEDGSFEGNIGWKKEKNDDEQQNQKVVLGRGTNQVTLKTLNGNITVNK